MTPEHNQALWIAYELAMEEWRRMRYPDRLKPRLPLQLGRHIDSLPVEINKPGTVNMPIPVGKNSTLYT